MSLYFTKLSTALTDSSIWSQDDQTRIVWITMLAMADSKGRVMAAVPGLANRARVSIEATEKALAVFLAPDPFSRTRDFEGRRIEPIDGGWRLLNYMKFREERDAETRREYQREWDRTKRQRKHNPTQSDKSDTRRPPTTKEEGEEEERETLDQFALTPAEEIYAAYPRKVGKAAALQAIDTVLKSGSIQPAALLEKVKKFAASPAGQKGNFTPHPRTFFAQERYLDEESEWNRPDTNRETAARPAAIQSPDQAAALSGLRARAVKVGPAEIPI